MITKLPSLAIVLAAVLLPLSGVRAITIDVGGGALISAGDTWRYFKGTTDPSSPADAWQEVGFDDSAWPTGASGFGYDDGDDATILNDMEMTGGQPGYATVYVRKEFELTSVPAGMLELVIDYDDGFVAYINGVEVQRSSNMPSGTPTFETTTDGNHEAGTAEIFVLGNAADFLNTGTNVLAVEGHNTSLDSSDFSLIPALRTASGVVQNGDTWIMGEAAPSLSGSVSSGDVASVTVGGVPVNFAAGTGQWDGAPTLSPGMNTVLVEGLDAGSDVVESATVEIIYLPAANHVSGALATDATWSGAVLLDGTVTVPAGVVLTVAPGTQVLMRADATLLVEGQLLAEGTENAPIHFTHYGNGTTWERLMFVQAEDSRLSHCVIEYSDCEGDHKDYYPDTDCETPRANRTYFQAVVALGCHLDIDGCLFRNLPDNSGGGEGDAIAVISDDPDLPPRAATATIRDCDFVGIGQGVHTRYSYVRVERCFFTGHHGDNDDIDLYGESTPPPLILNNVMVSPDHDDMINPTRCSAILVGNIIANCDDHGIVLRDKCSPVLINNLIYNCSSAAIAVQNQCDALLVNNTIIDCGRGIRMFDHTGRWGTPYCLFRGSGKATLINCIIRDCPTTFDLDDSPDPWQGGGSIAIVTHCNVEGGQGAASVSSNSVLDWGAGNIDLPPTFVDLGNNDYHLAGGSPNIDAGTDPLSVAPALAVLADRLGVDFDGLARPLDGDGDGTAAYDIGAYEFLLATADTNGDGIPDGWCRQHDLDPTDPDLATKNPDNDPFNTGDEWLADTDPTDAQSYFGLESISVGDEVTVSFESSADRIYTLLSSIDLQTWTPVAGQVGIAGTGGADSLVDADAGPRKFYAVGVELP